MIRPNDEPNPTPNPPSSFAWTHGLKFKLAAFALTLMSALFATGLAKFLKAPAEDKKPHSDNLFRGWDKPDLVLLLTAQQHGYVLPCGCSYPQIGGLERRYNFVQQLKARGWPVVGIDLGDVPQKQGPAKLANVQGLIKYRYSMMALKEMGYAAVGIGEYECAFPLAAAEGAWAVNEEQPALLAGNLKNDQNNFPFLKALETKAVPETGIKIGITSIVGPSVSRLIKDPNVKFNDSRPVLDALLKQMQAANVNLPVLLYHGHATGTEEAKKCAEFYPQFRVILCLSEEDEPPSTPIEVQHPGKPSNYVFRLGHKGKFVGVLGVYRDGPSFRFKYQLVEMGLDYAKPDAERGNNPINRMMEDYTRELKSKDYLQAYANRQVKHILQAMNPVPGLKNPGDGIPKYVGSERCGDCHNDAYKVWEKTPHSHAYKTLVDAKHPSLRQYDGECIVCHTVGFGYQTGFTDEVKTKKLINVGCESCHGPGSLHANNPQNPEWQARMNQPWRDARAKGNGPAKDLAIEKFCVTCHDIDNDVNWVHTPKKNPFKEKWIDKKIIHNTPKE